MNKQKRYLFISIVAMMLFLTGCGESLRELTAEEEKLVIHSAAYYVAKYNIQQKDGISGAAIPGETATEEDEASSEIETEQMQGSTTGDGQNQPEEPLEDSVSLAEVIDLAGSLQVSYQGNFISNNYKEGSAYIVQADAGKTFYVMQFKLTNTTSEAVEVNNASKSPVLKLVSDAVTVKSEVTFLVSDFSTYQGTIAAGESVDTILLFEVSETVSEQIVNPTLQISIGNSTKNIKL